MDLSESHVIKSYTEFEEILKEIGFKEIKNETYEGQVVEACGLLQITKQGDSMSLCL